MKLRIIRSTSQFYLSNDNKQSQTCNFNITSYLDRETIIFLFIWVFCIKFQFKKRLIDEFLKRRLNLSEQLFMFGINWQSLYNKMIQDQEGTLIKGELVCVAAMVLVLVWGKRRRQQGFKKRMQRERKVSSTDVDDQKIIVALQIDNLFLKYSNRKLTNYIKLQNQIHSQSYIEKLKGLFGYGEFYCLLQEKTKIRTFLRSLALMENVQLYLYTSLQREFTNRILKKLGVEHYFPEHHRRYCQDEDVKLNHKKHPAWVDSVTKRVMIVTANRDDFDQQDKKYFLILNRFHHQKMLRSAHKLIKHIIKNINSIDQLHAEMDEVKAQIETEWENDCVFQK